MEVVGRILDASRSRMQKGFSALHLAVQSSLDRLVQQLLVLPGTAVDARDADGLTALHWAASEGWLPLLIEKIGVLLGHTPSSQSSRCRELPR